MLLTISGLENRTIDPIIGVPIAIIMCVLIIALNAYMKRKDKHRDEEADDES